MFLTLMTHWEAVTLSHMASKVTLGLELCDSLRMTWNDSAKHEAWSSGERSWSWWSFRAWWGWGALWRTPRFRKRIFSAPRLKNIYFFLFILNNRLFFFMFSKAIVASYWTFEWTNETSAEHWYSLVHRAVKCQWGGCNAVIRSQWHFRRNKGKRN